MTEDLSKKFKEVLQGKIKLLKMSLCHLKAKRDDLDAKYNQVQKQIKERADMLDELSNILEIISKEDIVEILTREEEEEC